MCAHPQVIVTGFYARPGGGAGAMWPGVAWLRWPSPLHWAWRALVLDQLGDAHFGGGSAALNVAEQGWLGGSAGAGAFALGADGLWSERGQRWADLVVLAGAAAVALLLLLAAMWRRARFFSAFADAWAQRALYSSLALSAAAQSDGGGSRVDDGDDGPGAVDRQGSRAHYHAYLREFVRGFVHDESGQLRPAPPPASSGEPERGPSWADSDAGGRTPNHALSASSSQVGLMEQPRAQEQPRWQQQRMQQQQQPGVRRGDAARVPEGALALAIEEEKTDDDDEDGAAAGGGGGGRANASDGNNAGGAGDGEEFSIAIGDVPDDAVVAAAAVASAALRSDPAQSGRPRTVSAGDRRIQLSRLRLRWASGDDEEQGARGGDGGGGGGGGRDTELVSLGSMSQSGEPAPAAAAAASGRGGRSSGGARRQPRSITAREGRNAPRGGRSSSRGGGRRTNQ